MAITEERPLALPSGESRPSQPVLGVFRRPRATTGWRSWLTTVDHKRIGIMYGASSLFFLIVGGVEALLIRLQLAAPNGTLLSADQYNQIFTMHGTTMIFLVVMPLGAAFMNYLIPLQIGARDVAFPRINAFSFWTLLAGGILLNSSWFLGGAPDGGWFNYAPNSGVIFSPTHGIDFWNMGLIITGISSLSGAVNLITTFLNMRAPGMSLMKVPVFSWMALVTQFLLLFAIPVLTVAQVLLAMDRLFDANFFNVDAGADPLLWQHLFWIFGHPEVYLMIMPAFGIVSETVPVFSRKPIFGYPFIVFSGIAIGFMGFGVWAHHMFASGIGPMSVAAFSMATMFIAVPTGVKILNWCATMWGGRLKFDTPLLFACGLITMFTIGGLSGVTHAVAPADTQQTDTYYIVAHFHYVLFGGAFFGFMSGFYYWWPKAFGYRLGEKLGKWNFWLLFIGFNMTFGPMHILGLQGMSRRVFTYDANYGFEFWNMFATVGSFILAFAVLLFVINIFASKRKAAERPAPGPDPWDARTIEWMIPSPAPAHNFDEIPTVTSVDEFWHRKYAEDEHGLVRRVATGDEIAQPGDGTGVHLPSPSYWPLVTAIGLPLIGWGLIYTIPLAIAGVFVVVIGLWGWAMEPPDDVDPRDDLHDAHDAPSGDATEGSEAAEDASDAAEANELEEAPVG